jgi:hypothetical protein
MILRLLFGMILFWVVIRVFRAVVRMVLSRTGPRTEMPRPEKEPETKMPLDEGGQVIDVEFTEKNSERDRQDG